MTVKVHHLQTKNAFTKMVRRTYASYHVLRRMITPHFFLALVCFTFVVPIFWISSANRDDRIIQEALDNVARDIRYADVYRKADRQPRNLKYILLWTSPDYSPFYFLGSGQRAFLQNNCSKVNCYVSDDRNLLDGDITKFDAVAFNECNIRHMRRSQLPKKRSPHQKYIFFALESSDYYPVCQNIFEDFFNWTSTYRLDSDVPYPYIVVKDKNGRIVGPKMDMVWGNNEGEIDVELARKLQRKKKAAAWFVSNCSDRSGRRDFVRSLQKALITYGLTVDIYGACGNLYCPVDNREECDLMLERDYYFYLSLENSFAPDYVTEKLLTALQHDTVPIVYGDANYSRFLPPGSYLDARKQSPQALAAEMARIISSPKLYQELFKWRRHYSFYDGTPADDVCAVCEALNNKELMEKQASYKEFRKWWNPQFEDRCGWMDALWNI